MPFDPNTARPVSLSEPPAQRKNRGFDPSTARPMEPSGALRGLGDLGVRATRGILSGGQMLAAAAGAGNPVARGLGQAVKGVGELLSPEAQVQERMDAQAIREAEQSGSAWEEVKAQTGAFFHHPVGSTLEAAGSIAPTLVAAALTRGRALAPGLGAAQGASAVKGRVYDEVNQYYLTQGASAEEAARKASEAQAYAGENSEQIGLAGALGILAGATGAESAIGRIAGAQTGNAARGFTRNALAIGAREASTETVQGGQVRYAANQALRGEGSAVDPYQGVAGEAAQGFLGGFGPGVIVGGAESIAARPRSEPGNTDRPETEPPVPAEGGPPGPLALPSPAPPQGFAPPGVPSAYRREAAGQEAAREVADPLRGLAAPVNIVGPDGVVRTTEDRNAAIARARSGAIVDRTPVPETAPLPARQPPALPAPVIEIGPEGARTSADRNAQSAARLEAQAQRQDRMRRGEVLDRTPIPLSQQMGLDPSLGALSAAAATAVDSGAAMAQDPLARQTEIPAGAAEAPGRATGALAMTEGLQTAGPESGALADQKTETPLSNQTEGAIHHLPVARLTLSEEVPQFKSGANQEGIVEPLGGTFDVRGTGPLQVWRRLDGALEVISGRHRLDLARRSNKKLIPAQVYDEASGFGREQAAALDAELNIRDGQGKVADYVQYFQRPAFQGPEGRQEADSRGLLARSTGKRAYTIAGQGTPQLIAAHRAGQISDEAAVQIAQSAPGDERLQALGMQQVQSGRSILQTTHTLRALGTLRGNEAAQGDIFGFDDSAIRDAEAMARVAASHQRSLSERLSAMTGASKRPELARQEGIDVHNPKAVLERIKELKAEREAWENWATDPGKVAEVREEAGLSAPERAPAPSPEAVPARTEAAHPQDFSLAQHTQTDLDARAEAERQAAEREQAERAARGERPSGVIETARRSEPERTQGDRGKTPENRQGEGAERSEPDVEQSEESRGAGTTDQSTQPLSEQALGKIFDEAAAQVRAEIAPSTRPSQPSQDLAPAEDRASTPTSALDARELMHAIAAMMRREEQWRFTKEGDHFLLTTYEGDPIGTLPARPRSGNAASAAMGRLLAQKLKSEGIKLPSNPEEMSLDEFTIAYEGGVIPDFEIDLSEIGGVVKENLGGGFQVDIAELYRKVQAQRAGREEGSKTRPGRQAPALEAPKGGPRLEDFGAKLGGARKDLARSLSRELTDEDIASEPLSKIWPLKELDEISDPFASAVAYAARAEIPAKPRRQHDLES